MQKKLQLYSLLISIVTISSAMEQQKCEHCNPSLSKKFVPASYNEALMQQITYTSEETASPGSLVLVESKKHKAQWQHALVCNQSTEQGHVKVHLCHDHTITAVQPCAIRQLKKLWSILWQPRPPCNLLNNSFTKLFEVFNKPPYSPRVLAQILSQGTRILAIGDVHGSSRSLRTIIKSLFERKILDHNLHLKEGYVMVFTGDYTDRGTRGPETWDILSKLKQENPINVTLLRGNHETLSLALSNEFFNQMASSTLSDMPIAKGKELIDTLFNALPLGICLGTRAHTSQPFHFIIFCHGGIYPIVPFNQLLQTTVETYQKNNAQNRFGTYCKSIFIESSGILWNDFHANQSLGDLPASKPSDRGPGLKSFNSSAASEFIERYYSEHQDHPYIVDSIVRGHGHALGGVAQLLDVQDSDGHSWKALANNTTIPIRKPSVFTCTSSPEGLAMGGCIEDCYAELNFDGDQGWQITPHIVQYRIPKRYRKPIPK